MKAVLPDGTQLEGSADEVAAVVLARTPMKTLPLGAAQTHAHTSVAPDAPRAPSGDAGVDPFEKGMAEALARRERKIARRNERINGAVRYLLFEPRLPRPANCACPTPEELERTSGHWHGFCPLHNLTLCRV